MPTKKPAHSKSGKPVAKKAAKPAKAAAKKPVAKKAVKPVAKKAIAKHVKPEPKKAVVKKPAPKPVAKKSPAHPAKSASHPVKPLAQHPKPVAAPAPAPKPVVKEAVPLKKHELPAKSLVSVKPAIKSVVKKEPPKPTKMVIPKTTTKSIKKYEPEFTKSVLDTPMHENTGPTQRYSDSDLVEFRELIQKKHDAAKKELIYLQGLITRKDETGDMEDARYMTMEDGSVSMEREQLSQMASRQIQFIDHLEKALMRIENKTYGICRVTGKLIDKARLRAVPHATLSIEAKQMMNK
jgi:RNA polymerase-binding transcription factor DksA